MQTCTHMYTTVTMQRSNKHHMHRAVNNRCFKSRWSLPFTLSPLHCTYPVHFSPLSWTWGTSGLGQSLLQSMWGNQLRTHTTHGEGEEVRECCLNRKLHITNNTTNKCDIKAIFNPISHYWPSQISLYAQRLSHVYTSKQLRQVPECASNVKMTSEVCYRKVLD